MLDKILSELITLTVDVGEIIMSHRKNSGNFSMKSDNTPVTQADKESNELMNSINIGVYSTKAPNYPHNRITCSK